MKGSQGADLESFDAVHGVVHGTCRAGEVKYVIHLAAIKRLVDIDLLELETGFVAQMIKVRIYVR